ncbi:MAG TPA: hypothetical protein VFV78_04715 [Vicinamibacterales bacterium]|nr:hypothetical protein [Vicinamibacterales bacterium]
MSRLRGLGLAMALLSVSATEAWAQVPTPTPTAPPPTAIDEPFERPTNIMLGYQYLHDFSWDSSMVGGFSVSLTRRIKGNINIVGEVSGSYGETVNGFTIQRYAFLGGIKVTGGEGNIRPFFQVLGGLSRQGGDVGELNAPAIQPGGGADFFLNDRWTFRAQGDFRFLFEEGELRTAYRVTGGIVFYLGRKK